jgi:hypothetical protein
MTYRDLVREYFPGIGDEGADYILWEETPFPLYMTEEKLRPYLEELKAKHEAKDGTESGQSDREYLGDGDAAGEKSDEQGSSGVSQPEPNDSGPVV